VAVVRYLSLADVIALHAQIVERTGQAPAPLRDETLLQSALMRPQMAAHYEGADLIRQAVLLAVGISQAQAFLDGNKRIAFAACDVFLRINGRIIRADPVELARQLEQAASHTGDLAAATDRFERWLRPLISGE
jgi:death-on-curing protein